MKNNKREKKFDRNLKFVIGSYLAILILFVIGGTMLLLSIGEF